MLSYLKFCIKEAYKDFLISVRDKCYYVITAEECNPLAFRFFYRLWKRLDSKISNDTSN